MTKLYRGFSQLPKPSNPVTFEYENIFRQNPRTSRDTPDSIHKLVDDWFYENKQYGIKARSSTIICSTNIKQARTYVNDNDEDNIRQIVPKGDYSCIYCKGVKDMFDAICELIKEEPCLIDIEAKILDYKRRLIEKYDITEEGKEKCQKIKDVILEWLPQQGYIKTSINDINASKDDIFEVMLDCKFYFAERVIKTRTD